MNSPVNPFAILEGILSARHGRQMQEQSLAQQGEIAQAGVLSQLLARKQQQDQFAQTQGRLEREQMAQQQFRNAQLQAQGRGRQDMITAAKERQAAQIQAAKDALAARGAIPRRAYDPARGVVVDINAGTAAPVTGQDGQPLGVKASEKALPAPLQRQLTEAAEMADATTRFVDKFEDRFGGKTIVGGLSNTAGRILGDDTGQAQWWQDYELHQSQIRNKLFGSALTKYEIGEWNKAAVNPRMDSGQIRKNLERRKNLEQTALERLVKGAVAGKYSREQIEAFTGRAPPESPKRRSSDSAPVLRFDAQGNPVP